MTDKFDKSREYKEGFVDGHSAGFSHAEAELNALRFENFNLRSLLTVAQNKIVLETLKKGGK